MGLGVQLVQGDCLDKMGEIPDKSIDMILCDLPYGVTGCKWDVLIPFDQLWAQYNRVCKEGSAVVLTSMQPFTTHLIHSNLDCFKYCWVWDKHIPRGFQSARFKPMNRHEDVCVFSIGVVSSGSTTLRWLKGISRSRLRTIPRKVGKALMSL